MLYNNSLYRTDTPATAIMTPISSRFDSAAILLSGLCVLHCLMVPVVLALFPLVALSLGSETHFHGLALWLALPVSTVGLVLGTCRHRRWRIFVAGAAAMALLTFASTWGHDNLQLVAESLLMITASALLAAVHLWNWRSISAKRSVVPV